MLTQDCLPALFWHISQLCGYRARRHTRLPAHKTVDLIIDERKRSRNFLFASFLVLLDDFRQAVDITQLNVGDLSYIHSNVSWNTEVHHHQRTMSPGDHGRFHHLPGYDGFGSRDRTYDQIRPV